MVDVDYGYSVIFGIGGTFVTGVGSLALGLVLMVLWRTRATSLPFFRGESLNEQTPVLVPDSPDVYRRSIDGGLS